MSDELRERMTGAAGGAGERPGIDGMWRRGRSARRRHRVLQGAAAAVAIVALVAGGLALTRDTSDGEELLAGPTADGGVADAPPAEPTDLPVLMQIVGTGARDGVPTIVEGQAFGLRYSGDASGWIRGASADWQAWDGATWSTTHRLGVGWDDTGPGEVTPIGEDVFTPAIGLGGAGPDEVQAPAADPGWYRVCADMSADPAAEDWPPDSSATTSTTSTSTRPGGETTIPASTSTTLPPPTSTDAGPPGGATTTVVADVDGTGPATSEPAAPPGSAVDPSTPTPRQITVCAQLRVEELEPIEDALPDGVGPPGEVERGTATTTMPDAGSASTEAREIPGDPGGSDTTVAEGSEARLPPITGVDKAGQPFDSEALRGRWLIVLSDAGSCRDCARVNDVVRDFVEGRRAAGQDLAVVTLVPAGDDPCPPPSCVGQPIDWPIVILPDGDFRDVMLSLPRTLVVTPTGEVDATLGVFGAEDLEAILPPGSG